MFMSFMAMKPIEAFSSHREARELLSKLEDEFKESFMEVM